MKRSLLALLFSSAVLATLAQRPPKRRGNRLHDAPLLPRAEWLHLVGGAYQDLLADYYWVLTTYHTGDAQTEEEYRDVYDYANLTTDLDPDFRYVYLFAGSAIPFNEGREHWANTEESTRILEKGLRLFPDYVLLRIVLSYNYSYFLKRYGLAARLLEGTSRLPGAPAYLASLATRLYAQAGAFDAGLALSQSLAAGSADPDTRALFERRVKELELEKELQQVDAAIARFQKREGHLPPNVDALTAAGDLDKVPTDPMGGTILIDAEGRARSTSESNRLQIFSERVND